MGWQERSSPGGQGGASTYILVRTQLQGTLLEANPKPVCGLGGVELHGWGGHWHKEAHSEGSS